MASPTCQVPHLPKARCFLIQSNLAKAALARPLDSGCSSLTVACCPCHVLSLRTEATSRSERNGPGGHVAPRGTWRPPTPSREAEGRSRECPDREGQLGAGSTYSGTIGVCGVQTPPRLRCTGPGAFLLVARTPPDGGESETRESLSEDRRLHGGPTAVAGTQRHPPNALGRSFQTPFIIHVFTGKQASCSSKDANLKITQ